MKIHDIQKYPETSRNIQNSIPGPEFHFDQNSISGPEIHFWTGCLPRRFRSESEPVSAPQPSRARPVCVPPTPPLAGPTNHAPVPA